MTGPMTDTQLRRRQKVQSKIGRTTSTLGLVGVGLAGGGALAAKKPALLRKIPRYAKLGDEAIHAKGEKLKDAAFHTGIVSGGIGGVGGFNQAKIYSDEARRRKAATVKKSYGVDGVTASEEGHRILDEEIETKISKDWTPVSSRFDAERSRRNRSEAYPKIASGASGALAGGAVGSGIHAYFAHRGAEKYGRNLKKPQSSAIYRSMRAGVKAKGKTAAALAGGAALTGGAAAVLQRKHKSKSWQPYAKRDTVSAFGVDHADEIEKASLFPARRKKKQQFYDNYGANVVAGQLARNPQFKQTGQRSFESIGKAINIKPSHEGRFTAFANKKGKGIQEAAQSVVSNPKSSETRRKQAQFAINARKWHHGK